MNKFYKDKGGWSKGHLLNLSIGQGEVSVTPIQVIQLINSIANNGILHTPHLNIKHEFKRTNINTKIHQLKRLCTMKASTYFCNIPGPYGPKWPKLEELYEILFGKQ